MLRSLLRFLLPFVPVAAAVACSSTPADPPAEPEADLVVGVQEDDVLKSLVGSAHVVVKMAGAVVSDQTIAGTALPLEVPVKGKPGAAVEVSVDATQANGATVISRIGSTALTAGNKRLLRIVLDQQCVNIPGSVKSITCAAPTTCSNGGCIASGVSPDQLEDYEAGWAAAPPDICRPAHHGAPELMMGTGMTDYAPLVDGQVLQLEQGPQGGHHIWLATRMKNLRRSGSTTFLSAKLLGDPNPNVTPAAYVFTFDPDEGSYCKLWGLRFQLDADATDFANDYKRFLGKDVEVTITVTDSTKASASATRRVHIADKLLCADGTDGCTLPTR